MNRRNYLKAVLSGCAVWAAKGAHERKPIELHVDLAVNPAKESEMLHTFQTQFRPAATKQAGFIDAKMLKLRSAVQGSAPPSANYRFVLTFETEEQRQKWVASDVHVKLWPKIESTLLNKNYTVLLYDET